MCRSLGSVLLLSDLRKVSLSFICFVLESQNFLITCRTRLYYITNKNIYVHRMTYENHFNTGCHTLHIVINSIKLGLMYMPPKE